LTTDTTTINFQVSQALRELNRVGVAVEKVNTATGSAEKQLTQAQRAMNNYGRYAANASKALTDLRAAQRGLSSDLNAANRQINKQKKALEDSAVAVKSAAQKLKDFQKQAKSDTAAQSKIIAQQADQIDKLRLAMRNAGTIQPISDKALANVKGYVKALAESNTKGLVRDISNPTKLPAGSSFSGVSSEDTALKRLQSTLALTNEGQLKFSAGTQKLMDSTKKGAASITDMATQNVALRYALQSTASTFGSIARGGADAIGGLIEAGVEYQKQVAAVIRTSQVATPSTFKGSPLVSAGIVTQAQQAAMATKSLSDAFLTLESTLPVTTEDLTTIATLGSQMGISAGQIVGFTQTVAEFSAATGISADASATGLARLAQLVPTLKTASGDYNDLASAILKTGVNSIATEAQILQTAQNIAGLAGVAHLSQNDIIALSSATASLGITSELARSALTQSFTKILTATNEGASASEKFGDVMGKTGAQFIKAFGADSYGTFVKLMEAISKSKDPIAELQSLGLASQRLTPTLLKIGQNADVFNKAWKDTTQGAKQGTELTRQFGIIAKTTAAQLQVLSQEWNAFIVRFGAPVVATFGAVAEGIGGILNFLNQLVNNPAGQWISYVVIGLLALGTAIAAVVSGVALFGASLLGINYVFEQFSGSGTAAAATTEAMAASAAEASVALAALAESEELSGDEALALGGKIGVAAGAMDAFSLSSSVASAKSIAAGFSFKTLATNVASSLGPMLAVTAAVVGLGVVLQNAQTYNKDFIGAPSDKNNLKDLQKVGPNSQGALLAKEYSGAPAIASWDRGLQGLFGSDTKSVSQADTYLKNLAQTNAPAAEEQLELLNKAWTKNKGSQAAFNALFPDTISALDLVQGKTGGTAEALAKYAATQKAEADAAQKQADVQQELADNLGLVTDQYTTASAALATYTQSLQSAATNGIDTTSLIQKSSAAPVVSKATGKVTTPGGTGIDQLKTGLDKSLKDYRKWADNIQKLTAEGAGAMAQAFVAAGPSSERDVEGALKLSPKARAAINASFIEAAFYASKNFTDVFESQSAVLADIYKKVLAAGGNPQQAIKDASKDLGKNGTLSTKDIAGLDRKYGITINLDINKIDPKNVTDAIKDAQDAANTKPVTIKTKLLPSPNTPAATVSTKEYDVTEKDAHGLSHEIILTVSPDTKKGQQTLDAWRANNYKTPVKLKANVDTTSAEAKLAQLRNQFRILSETVNVHVNGGPNVATTRAKGGAIGIPGYANGGGPGMFRGPGTGTSDSILAAVSNGEYINTAASVRHYGAAFFDALNKRKFPRFANGGGVGSPNYSGAAGSQVNINVVQNYPTTVDPMKKLKQDAESLVAGLWN
jgi:TP901 family phage tail tape measure protein